MNTPKVVSDPIYGIIDIRPVLPMIETPEFQALGDKRQLGMSYLTFPSATHTRKAHSLGAYHATRELADWWIKRDFITAEEADALAGYALYHDIGHPAFSHVTEDLCITPENAKGLSGNSALSLEIIRRRRKEIEACGINFALVKKMAEHEHPLHQAVSDKNLGMEKFDYLERDGACTILSRPVGLPYLRQHIYFIDKEIAIDEKVTDNAVEVQNFYLKIYKNVYLRKTSAIAQRMMQKMTYELIRAGELRREDLPALTDSELIGIMHSSKNSPVAEMYRLLKNRDLFRETIVIRPKQFANGGQSGKPITVLGATETEIAKLSRSEHLQPKDQEGLAKIEDTIAKIAGIPSGTVLITPIFGAERFEAKDILIYEGENKKLASLKARYPAHFENIEEVAQSYLTFRVCTLNAYRARLAEPKIAKKVFEMLV